MTAEKELTAKQFGEKIGRAPATVRGWCLAGEVPGAHLADTPLGSVWLIPEKTLRGFTPPKMGRPKDGARSVKRAAKKR